MPSSALKIALIRHPPRKARAIPRDDFANGSSQIPWITATRGILKSETLRPSFRSYQGRPLIPLENALPTSVDDRDRQIFRYVSLNVEGPLHHVITMRTRLDIRLGKSGPSKDLRRSSGETARRRVAHRADHVERRGQAR